MICVDGESTEALVIFVAVTNYNNVVDGGSDSDDEDKLHIVEEDGGLADSAECDNMLPEDEHRGGHCWDGGKFITFMLKHANSPTPLHVRVRVRNQWGNKNLHGRSDLYFSRQHLHFLSTTFSITDASTQKGLKHKQKTRQPFCCVPAQKR